MQCWHLAGQTGQKILARGQMPTLTVLMYCYLRKYLFLNKVCNINCKKYLEPTIIFD